MSRRPTSVLAAALAVVLQASGCSGGCSSKEGSEHELAPVALEGDRFRATLFDDDIARGGDAPLVTIVMYTDYACPPCGRSWQVMDHLLEDYGDDLRVVYRSFTVPGFSRGEQAAEAAFAAEAQGKFWRMHRRLFEKPVFDRPSLRAHAESVGLDVDRFMDELDTGAHTARRVRHRRQAKKLGVPGLPASFVNGHFVAGFRDEDTWHGIIDAEIVDARKRIDNGTPRARLYEAIMADAVDRRVPPPEGADELREDLRNKKAATEPPKKIIAPKPAQRYQITPGDAPAIGPENAPVVVVAFVDLQCPFCRKAWAQELAKLVDERKGEVRFAIRQLPLEGHPSADGAAKATLAAHRQGKYWEMLDRLLTHEGELGRSVFVQYAEDLGLDRERFETDFDDPKLAEQIAADIALANEVGVTGTPAFFVNGRYASGFKPGQLPEMIDEEKRNARELGEQGTPPGEVFTKLMSDAVPRQEFPNR